MADPQPDEASASAALALADLRRHLIRRAVAVAAKARAVRRRGDVVGARRLQEQADRLRASARTVGKRTSP